MKNPHGLLILILVLCAEENLSERVYKDEFSTTFLPMTVPHFSLLLVCFRRDVFMAYIPLILSVSGPIQAIGKWNNTWKQQVPTKVSSIDITSLQAFNSKLAS